MLFILACLTLPILWGWLVHALFTYFSRIQTSENDDSIFPDFQI